MSEPRERSRVHISLHARPPGVWPAQSQMVLGRTIRLLEIPPGRLCEPFSVTFEAAYAALEILPRLFIEPDGSFVWVGDDELGRPWQLDGMLYDGHAHLQYVELKGSCPNEVFHRLITALDNPLETTLVQFAQLGVVTSAVDFCAFNQD